MPRTAFTSPQLEILIEPEDWDRARQASSGGCLLADGIKQAYPHLTGITVDMATIRVTDRKRGLRFTYLTPKAGQELLLSYDQGWGQPAAHRVIAKSAVKISPITSSKARTARRQERLAELEARKAAGEKLTPADRAALKKLKAPGRPSTTGKAEVRHARGRTTVRGGADIPAGSKGSNPNLLRGRDRHFGAKVAQPAQAFAEAVEAEVQERLAALAAGEASE